MKQQGDEAARREKQRRKSLRMRVLDELFSEQGDPDVDTSGPDAGENAVHVHIHGGSAGAAPAPAPGNTEDDFEGGGGGAGAPAAGAPAAGGASVEERLVNLEKGHAAILAKLDQLLGNKGGTGDEGGEETPPKEGEEEAPPAGNGEEEETRDDEAVPTGGPAKTMDSGALATSYQKLIADAEILVPGFRMPTFDAKAVRKKTVDAMCNARRKALDLTYATQDGKQLVDSVANASADLDLMSMDCKQVATLFNSAVGAKKLLNNRMATADAQRMPNQGSEGEGRPMSNEDLNKLHAEYWAKRQ